MNNKIMKLRDGRFLGYTEYGVPDGHPILFFHGLAGGARLDAVYLHQAAVRNHCRLIGIDRPGVGLSSMDSHRTILSWADDVEAFAENLNIQQFSIIGHSAGAPFAAACAYKIPSRLTGVAIVAGMGPFEIPEATASLSRGQRFLNKVIKAMPWVATCCMTLTSMMFKSPRLLQLGLKQMPEEDQIAIRSLGSDEAIAAMMMESFKQGVAGTSQEMRRIIEPWGI